MRTGIGDGDKQIHQVGFRCHHIARQSRLPLPCPSGAEGLCAESAVAGTGPLYRPK